MIKMQLRLTFTLYEQDTITAAHFRGPLSPPSADGRFLCRLRLPALQMNHADVDPPMHIRHSPAAHHGLWCCVGLSRWVEDLLYQQQ